MNPSQYQVVPQMQNRTATSREKIPARKEDLLGFSSSPESIMIMSIRCPNVPVCVVSRYGQLLEREYCNGNCVEIRCAK